MKRSRPSKEQRIAKAEAKIQRWLRFIDDGLDQYEKDQPHWLGLALCWLMESSFTTLREASEHSRHTRRFWENPFITSNYYVDWNWKPAPSDPAITYGALSSRWTNSKLRREALRIMVQTIMQTTLQRVTCGVALQKRGNVYNALLPLEVLDVVKRVKGSGKRQQLLDELYRPFSMGAATVSLDESKLVAGRRLTVRETRELQKANHQIDLPPITVTITKDDGNTLTVIPVFQISQLVVDARAKRAYYPLTAGLVIQPHLQSDEEIHECQWANPATWPVEDRRQFWDAVVGVFSELVASLKIKSAPNLEDAVLTVSAKIRVRVSPGDPDAPNRAINQMLQHFSQTGTILEMQHDWDGKRNFRHDWGSLLRDVEKATPSEKGKSLERLAAALFASVPGFEINKSNSRTQTEEIDLVILHKSDDSRWRGAPPLILVECKHRKQPADKSDIVEFRTKLQNRRGQCKLGFLMSISGFTAAARDELRRDSKDDLMIGLIDGEMIREAVKTSQFLPILQRAWDAAAAD